MSNFFWKDHPITAHARTSPLSAGWARGDGAAKKQEREGSRLGGWIKGHWGYLGRQLSRDCCRTSHSSSGAVLGVSGFAGVWAGARGGRGYTSNMGRSRGRSGWVIATRVQAAAESQRSYLVSWWYRRLAKSYLLALLWRWYKTRSRKMMGRPEYVFGARAPAPAEAPESSHAGLGFPPLVVE